MKFERDEIFKFKDGENVKYISDTSISGKAFYIANIIKDKRAIVISSRGEDLKGEIEDFYILLKGKEPEILLFPPYGGSYDRISPHQELEIKRVEVLWKLISGKFHTLIVHPETLITKIISPLDLIDNSFEIKKGKKIEIKKLTEILLLNGYVKEEKVFERGEFSKRGGVVDFFPPQEKLPVRVEFFGDEIDSIRHFHPETQLSLKEINSTVILPTSQFNLRPDEKKEFIKFLEKKFKEEKFREHLFLMKEEINGGENPPGVEFLIRKFKGENSSIIEYLDKDVIFIFTEDNFYEEIRENFLEKERKKYEENIFKGIPSLPLSENYKELSEIEEEILRRKRIYFSLFKSGYEIAKRFVKETLSPLKLVEKLRDEKRYKIFLLKSEVEEKNLIKILQEYEIPYTKIDGRLPEKLEEKIFYISHGNIEESFTFTEKFLFISGKDIFGEKKFPSTKKKNIRRLSTLLADYKNLREGDYVIHAIYGVGIFKGIKKITAGNITKEVVEIEYRDGDRVYVPVERFDLIYKHNLETKPTVEKLGSRNWERIKKRVKRGIREMARELIKLYAEREIVKGYSFQGDPFLEGEFENLFEFEETPDQMRTIEEVKRDMEKAVPMERLICGDVGFGKTEVAMRAAFRAVISGKQVAFLTPTTVLSFQHYNTFKKRFSQFPINVDFLSRFKTKREQKEILERLKDGNIDIIIGTHRLLSKDVKFRDLGLLIVDEEQRFGVRHKEKIKMLNKKIDVLYLSATPIPRTLYMALSGIRNISVIETPPTNRLAIQTHILTFSPEIIEDGIRKELKRGGQVFFVHNRVYDIYEMGNYIQHLIPEAKIAIAHGQMKEKELEEIMVNFINGRYDILITTTIIENGIDMPNVNTIFINDAHKFGLAQLYQLRGRVGRSDVPAYAYLLAPPLRQLTDTAKERLLALKDLNELGSGFKLASLDLKLRGAGNILGKEQHGFLDLVGFELYCKWLSAEVEKLRGRKEFLSEEVEISLGIKMEIPEEYIPEQGERIKLYKEIASSGSEEELKELKERIRDQYGKFPERFEYLFQFTLIRILAQKCGIISLKKSGEGIKLKFSKETPIKPQKIMEILKNHKNSKFSPDGTLTIKVEKKKDGKLLKYIIDLLDSLT